MSIEYLRGLLGRLGADLDAAADPARLAAARKTAHTLAACEANGRLAYFHYPVDASPRYGWGRPGHPLFEAAIAGRLPEITRRLDGFLAWQGFFAGIAADAASAPAPHAPYWGNTLLPIMDAVALCGMIGEFQPRRFIEIGSGSSTRFARAFVEHHGLPTEIVSIDAYPGDTIPGNPHHLIREPLERTDLSVFDALDPGDLVWMDGSHRSYSNTDVTVFVLEVLPRLAPGVVIGIHDICLPWDYPPGWETLYFNEIQIVAAFLLGALPRLEVLMPCLYVHTARPEFSARLAPFWDLPAVAAARTAGSNGAGGFWFRLGA